MEVKKKACDGEDCRGKLQYIWKNVVEEDGERKRYCKSCYGKIKPTTALKRTPLPKQTTPVNKKSDRRKRLDAAYNVLRKSYLEAHPNCQIKLPGCTGAATDIHHLFWGSSREQHMNDFANVLASCRKCHDTVHTKLSKEEAIELGFKKEA